MALPLAPPIDSEVVVADFSRKGSLKLRDLLPRLMIQKHWLDYFGVLEQEIQVAPARRAATRVSPSQASIGNTPLALSSIGAGLWRVSFTIYTLTPATTSSSLQVGVSWTQGVTRQILANAITTNQADDAQSGTIVLRSDSDQPISFSVDYVSVGLQPLVYGIDVMAEELALDTVG